MKLEDVSKLSPTAADTASVGAIKAIESFMPPDAGEKAARFFKDMVL